MKKLLLLITLALGFSVVRADETNFDIPFEKESIYPWETNGLYLKYGLGSDCPIPYMLALGTGYFARTPSGAVDVSAMIYSIFIMNVIEGKALYLPVVNEKVHFGIGPSYLHEELVYLDVRDHIGLGLLFRKVSPKSPFFFQLEANAPLVTFDRRNVDFFDIESFPSVSFLLGTKF